MNAERKKSPTRPVVLIISGHDPSGGAGACADIQAVSALACHPAPVLTSLTIQDTQNAHDILALDAEFVARQIDVVVADMRIAAVKIGLLANAEIARAVADALTALDDVPVVLDPVLVAAGGATLADSDLVPVLMDAMLSQATVVTPNAAELMAMSGSNDPDTGARRLLDAGARHVLVKGADLDTTEVCNRLYGIGGLISKTEWPRLPHHYHGSGCTLASAIAALLASGVGLEEASDRSQSLVWNWLATGYRPGKGQHVPWRQATPLDV